MDAQISFGLTIGVTSGLVTAILIWVVTVVWRKNLVPWYESAVYKGVRIQGVWHLDLSQTINDPWTHSESLSLSQNAHRISGTATLSAIDDSGSPPRSLIVVGEISDRIVTLTLRSPLSDRLSYSSLLLEVVGDGTEMRGETTFYNTENSKIQSAPVRYLRKA